MKSLCQILSYPSLWRGGWCGCLLGILLLLAGCAPPPPPGDLPDGVLDLRAEGLHDVMELKGQWRAFDGPDTLALAAFDLPDDDWRRAAIPSFFTEQGFDNEGLVWYRLHLRLPPGLPPPRVHLGFVGNASAFYVARPGRAPLLLGASGHPTDDAATAVLRRAPITFSLPADTALVLTWKVANHDYKLGGPFYAPLLGTQQAMHRYLVRKHVMTLLLAGFYVALAVFFLLYWLWQRDDAAPLVICLLALAMALRTVTVEGYFEVLAPAFTTFHVRTVLELLSFYILPPLFLTSLWALYPGEFTSLGWGRRRLRAAPASIVAPPQHDRGKPLLSRRRRRLNAAVVTGTWALALAFIALLLVLPPRLNTYPLQVYKWVALGVGVVCLLMLGQIIERRRPMSRTLGMGLLLVIATGIHDILVGLGIFAGQPYVAPYGFLIFTIIQSYIVARRNALNAQFVRHHAAILQQEVTRRTEALRVATDEAQEANEAKSRFLSAVSHELRAPMTAIIGFTDALQEDLRQRLTDQENQVLATIRNSGERLLRMINDLLDLAKAEAGHLDLVPDDVALGPLAHTVAQEFMPLADAKGLALRVEDTDAPLVIHADADRVRQVLTNLVSNALKFTEAGSVTIGLAPGLMPDGHTPAALLTVTDTGRGMAPQFLPRLFQRFTQERRALGEVGTGLGLSIVHELVARMHGHIDVASTPGAGSRFTVALPRTAGPSPEAPAPAPAADDAVASAR